MRSPNTRFNVERLKDEGGQAVVLVALAMSIFLLAAVGLAVDGAHLYAQRQMAQSAADAAAQAGISSIFTGSATFPTTKFTCSAADAAPGGRSPCQYAASNGFSASSGDTIVIDYPGAAAAPGVALSPDFPTNLLRATITRSVGTTLMRLLGPTASSITTTATAAIVTVVAPVPILVTHPTLQQSFSINGTPAVTICGGPHRSIQVNSGAGAGTLSSSKSTAIYIAGNSYTIDLSHAGPPDTGNCATGTGAELGVYGGPYSAPSNYLPGSTGKYQPGAFPIPDPLIKVPVPPRPSNTPTPSPLANGSGDCPASTPVSSPCQVYIPGLYKGGIDAKGSTAIFKPGIYYIEGNQGFGCTAVCAMIMGSGTDPSTPSTGWTGHMLVYNTNAPPSGGFVNAGSFNVGSNGSAVLVGSPANSVYKGILFFQDRDSVANTGPKNRHNLGGGGNLNLQGTIYITNRLGTMTLDPSHYQEVQLQGNPGSSTLIQGEIIVSTLGLGGNAGITMNLNSNATLNVSQIALVN